MDGTFADLYAVEGWHPMLRNHNPFPYENAKPMLNMSAFARLLHKAQKLGYEVCVLSWLAKNSTVEYDKAVTMAKLTWLEKHLPSVRWDRITIVEHGVPKDKFCELPCDILFDDEQKNRENWWGCSYGVENIFEILKNL